MSYGLTSTGFVTKPFSVIQSELQEEYKAIHGDDLDVSDYSLAGQEINNLAKKIADQWELLAAVYASFNPDSNSGVSLDGSAALVGITRPAPIPSECLVIMYGDDGTVVPADTLIEQTTTKLQFGLYSDTTISNETASDITVSCVNTPATSEVYSINIDGSIFSYTVVGTKTKQEVLHELYLIIVAAAMDIAVVEGTEVLQIISDDMNVTLNVTASATLEFSEIGTAGRFVCTVDGANYVPTGTLQTILSTVTGLDAVDNIVSGTTGRDIMGDDEFRIYRRNNLQTNAKSTEEAIQSNVGEVTGVTYVRVISNRTLVTDADGRPAKSFETIVDGGDEDEIAETIWVTMPAGIEPYGDISKTVIDSSGRDQIVEFSRPIKKYIWLDIEIDSSGLEPVNASQLIKDAIYNWSLDPENVSIGMDIIYEKHFAPIYSVEGVKKTNFVKIAMMDDSITVPSPGDWVTANIELTDKELAEYATSRMEVILL